MYNDECAEDPRDEWFMELRGAGGQLLYGHNEHSFWVDTTSGRFAAYMKLDPIEYILGDGEARFRFRASDFGDVLKLFKPRRIRKISPETRARLEKTQFKHGQGRAVASATPRSEVDRG